MGDFIVLFRILLGWFGIWLASNGVPPELIQLLTKDPTTTAALAGLVGQIIGAVLAAVQLAWWQLSKRFGWAT